MGFYCQLKVDKVAQYVQHHRAVWPEVLILLRRAGFCNYTIYLNVEQRLLFSSFEYTGTNLEQSSLEMNADPVAAKWQTLTQDCFEHSTGWQRLQEIFHLD